MKLQTRQVRVWQQTLVTLLAKQQMRSATQPDPTSPRWWQAATCRTPATCRTLNAPGHCHSRLWQVKAGRAVLPVMVVPPGGVGLS